MKQASFRNVVIWIGLIIVIGMGFMFPTSSAHAQGVFPTPDQILAEIIQLITGGFVSLIGVPALIAAVVNVLKFVGLVKDDTASSWSAGLSLLGFVAVVLFRILRPDIMLDVLDGYSGQIAQIIVYLMGFIVMMFLPAAIHAKLKAAQVPLLGKSFSQ